MPEFLKVMENWDGFVSVRKANISEAALVRVIGLLAGQGMMPHQHRFLLQEAIGTSDFPQLFGQVLDRQLLAGYKAWIPNWRGWVKTTTVPDFNLVYRHKVQGADNELLEVPQGTEYPEVTVSEARYSYNVAKYGRRFPIFWEAIVNDSMGAFKDIVQRFVLAATRTEAKYVTGLYSSATGPNSNLFGAPIADVDGQNVTNLGALPLSIPNLETTLLLMSQQTDVNGEPITVRGVHLVVPPALELTARQILTSVLKMWTESAGGAAVPYPTSNILPQMGLKLHVDPYLTVIDVSAKADETWYLFADPSQGVALEFAYLRGHETPEICMKASNKVTVGGAPLGVMSGDIDTDTIQYRIRTVFGGSAMDPRFAYAQTGS